VDVDEVVRATTDQHASLSPLDGDRLEASVWRGSIPRSTPSVSGCATAPTVEEALLREQIEPEATILAAQQLLQIDRAHEGAGARSCASTPHATKWRSRPTTAAAPC
jgi:hypothetical protein